MDTWLPPYARPTDLLAILDTDSPLLTLFLPELLYVINGNMTGKVAIPVVEPNTYEHDDETLLGGPAPYNSMGCANITCRASVLSERRLM